MKSGDIISSKYRLLKQLGTGAMGEVWEGVNERTNRKVALKLIIRPSADHRQRLLREAQMCGRIEHRNIVEIYDVAETDTGDPFLVMQLLNGETLADLLVRRRRLDPPLTVRIAREVASALAAAHDARIIHRDLKPANIFLHREAQASEQDFTVKVLDFGVGKDLGASTSLHATATGMIVGSYAYMSPEQIRAAKDLDHRSDLWTLGIILFEMLTGERPFRETQQTIVGEVLSAPIPLASSRVRHVPPELDAIVAKCLERDRSRRYQDAREIGHALAALAEMSIAGRALTSASGPSPLVPPATPSRPGMSASTSPERVLSPKASHPSLPGVGAAPDFRFPPAATSTPLPGALSSSGVVPAASSSGASLPGGSPSSGSYASAPPSSAPRPLVPSPTTPPQSAPRLGAPPGPIAVTNMRGEPLESTQPLAGNAGARSPSTPWDTEAKTVLHTKTQPSADDVTGTQVLEPAAPTLSWREEMQRALAARRAESEAPVISAEDLQSGGTVALPVAPFDTRATGSTRSAVITTTSPLEQLTHKTAKFSMPTEAEIGMIDAPTLPRSPKQRPLMAIVAGGSVVTAALIGIFVWRLSSSSSTAGTNAAQLPASAELASAAPAAAPPTSTLAPEAAAASSSALAAPEPPPTGAANAPPPAPSEETAPPVEAPPLAPAAPSGEPSAPAGAEPTHAPALASAPKGQVGSKPPVTGAAPPATTGPGGPKPKCGKFIKTNCTNK